MDFYILSETTTHYNFAKSRNDTKTQYVSVIAGESPMVFICDSKKEAIFYILADAEYWHDWLKARGRLVVVEYVKTQTKTFAAYLQEQPIYPLTPKNH